MTELNRFQAWVGRGERRTDVATAGPLAALSAMLDRDDPEPMIGSEVPPLWHWLYFAPAARQAALGRDGNPERGGFLPPVPLPRRMWAGSRMRVHQPIWVGDTLVRQSRISRIDAKAGRDGPLVFVSVHHDVGTSRGGALSEEWDIVFRDAPRARAAGGGPGLEPAPRPAPTDETFSRRIAADPMFLFRYSALTYNAHRIHYDRTYATEVEGYPGLVVQGPLVATLLIDLARRHVPGLKVRGFNFRALRPLFDNRPFTICGRPDDTGGYALWARDHEGWLAMQATIDAS